METEGLGSMCPCLGGSGDIEKTLAAYLLGFRLSVRGLLLMEGQWGHESQNGHCLAV